MTTTQAGTVTEVTRGRAATIALWTLQILLGTFFVFGGLNKLLVLQPEVAVGFAKIGFGDWFRVLTGVMELGGGIGLLIPRICGVAALELAVVMVGAVLAHLLVLPPAFFAIMPGSFGVVFLFIAYARRREIAALIGKVQSLMGGATSRSVAGSEYDVAA